MSEWGKFSNEALEVLLDGALRPVEAARLQEEERQQSLVEVARRVRLPWWTVASVLLDAELQELHKRVTALRSAEGYFASEAVAGAFTHIVEARVLLVWLRLRTTPDESLCGVEAMMYEEEVSERRAKGKDYADFDGSNAMANFDRNAERQNLTPFNVLMVFLEKHVDSIAKWAAGQELATEGIEGRIKDARVYLWLLAGMFQRYKNVGESQSEES